MFEKYLQQQELVDYLIIRPRISKVKIINLNISESYFYGSEVIL
jgi:hypothetical protein